MNTKAEDWRWNSVSRWLSTPERVPYLLSPWPILCSPNWTARVNPALTDNEFVSVRHSVQRGLPFGGPTWVDSIVRRYRLQTTLRTRAGRTLAIFTCVWQSASANLLRQRVCPGWCSVQKWCQDSGSKRLDYPLGRRFSQVRILSCVVGYDYVKTPL